jgi:hypothetical protein
MGAGTPARLSALRVNSGTMRRVIKPPSTSKKGRSSGHSGAKSAPTRPRHHKAPRAITGAPLNIALPEPNQQEERAMA